ncbi:MAG: DUF4190 domain-containing protein [Elusimicrobia bacterium]|nr:DUF4190 domain-containing protein [Elusimicrobiota bacterium]
MAADEVKSVNEVNVPVKTSGMAVASLVCSILAVIIGPLGFLPGIIFGHIANSQIEEDPKLGGKGLATAGLIIGYVFLGLTVVTVTLFLLVRPVMKNPAIMP